MKFTTEVADRLKCYVYRLIDPRNGETFYVGRGKGNRIFQHVKGELGAEADDLSHKLRRIREIRVSGFEVGHLIHRHGIDEATAREVEAALIDAYPEAHNEVIGAGSDERGVMHAQQIIERYEALEAEFRHKILMINVNRSILDKPNVYESVRYAWKLDPSKARKADVVLAVQQGLIIGAFVATRWLRATPDNFPGTVAARPGRWGFIGHESPPEIAKLYLRRRVPDDLRRPGAANPLRYTY
ncbi:MAG: LEM-3-like GIY-YIG domain-containing protein [Steroidobacteraceae bacterium]